MISVSLDPTTDAVIFLRPGLVSHLGPETLLE